MTWTQNEMLCLNKFILINQSNCAAECQANITFLHCQCVPSYMPRNDAIDICGPAEKECVESTLQEHSSDIYEDHIPGTVCMFTNTVKPRFGQFFDIQHNLSIEKKHF